MLKYLVAFLSIAGAAGSAGAAVVTYHSDAQSLTSSLSNIATEDFSDLKFVEGLSISGPDNVIAGGTDLYHFLRTGASSTFSFADGVHGFGWDIRSSGFRNLDVTLIFDDGSRQALNQLSLNPTFKFFGLTADKAITAVTLTAATTTLVYIDEMTFGDAAVAAVPEPASWAMMIAGFGLAGAALRRRERVAGFARG